MGEAMKIVAILQNQWFKDPVRVKRIIEEAEKDHPNAREFYIKTFLFWGCLTGRRLRKILGEEYCEEIVWEECSRQIGGCASSRFPADIEHIKQVIAKHKPRIVIAFGQLAKDALMQLYYNNTDESGAQDYVLLIAPHPAARQGDVIQQLRTLRKLLDDEREYDANLHRLDTAT